MIHGEGHAAGEGLCSRGVESLPCRPLHAGPRVDFIFIIGQFKKEGEEKTAMSSRQTAKRGLKGLGSGDRLAKMVVS